MITSLLFSFVALLPQGRTVTEYQSRVPGTYFYTSLWLEDYKEDAETFKMLKEGIGDKVLMTGTMKPEGSNISIIVEREGSKRQTGAEWRAKYVRVKFDSFDVGDIACAESVTELGPVINYHHHGFLIAAGRCFDVHTSGMASDSAGVASARTRFEEIMKTMRILTLRRGFSEDYPEKLGDLMHRAAVAFPDYRDLLAKEKKARPTDWMPHFVLAETTFTVDKFEEAITSYPAAIELLTKIKEPTPKERFTLLVAYDGLGAAYLGTRKPKEALTPLMKGYDLAKTLKRDEKNSLAYNIACAHSLLKAEGKAVEYLKIAIEGAEKYRASAKKDADFENVRKNKAFLDLVNATPAGK